MDLEFWGFPASNDRFMISIDSEVPAIDIIDEVSEAVLDGHKFSNICTVSLLFWP